MSRPTHSASPRGVGFWLAWCLMPAVAVGVLTLTALRTTVSATPLYAIRAARACNTCHIEPTGWHDPPEKKDRRCSLNCSVCHVNRTGGGLRTPAGDYYGLEVLPTFSFDERPSTYGDPERYRAPSDTYSTHGAYSLWAGFSGWKSGETEVRTIADRYGDLDPDPIFTVGLDARLMVYQAFGRDPSVFPMQLDGHFFVSLHELIRVYGTLGLQGRQTRTVNDADAETDFKNFLTLRELVVDFDGVPYNGYVRAGRFMKPYGWRHPDHTIGIRKPLDYDQFAQVWGVEAGINPNYLFTTVAAFYQGAEAFPGERAPKGAGASFIAGYRDLGWQAGLSFEGLKLFDAKSRVTLGPMWGINLYPITYLGEIDIRVNLGTAELPGDQTGLYIYNEVNAIVYRGVSLLISQDWYRDYLEDSTTERAKVTFGLQWDVLQNLQLASQFRLRFNDGALAEKDFLFWMHVWL